MTLHIYLEGDPTRTHVASLSSVSLDRLAPALRVFKHATGIEITEYDDVRVADNHSRLLAGLIDQHLPRNAMSPELCTFRTVLQHACQQQLYLYTVGE